MKYVSEAAFPNWMGSHVFLVALWYVQVSHTINELSFGAHFPGAVNPLDGYKLDDLLLYVSYIFKQVFKS